jgi:uncharacterized membrane protein
MSKSDKSSEVVIEKKSKNWNIGAMFWGLLFVLIGVLLLLNNFGIIEVNLSNIWQLWPVVIIGIGLSVLSPRGWLWGIISVILTIAMLGLVAFAVIDNPTYRNIQGWSNQDTKKLSDDAVNAAKIDITIDTPATSLSLSSSDSRRGVEAIQQSKSTNLNIDAETRGDTRYIRIGSESSRRFWFRGDVANNLDIDLTRKLPVSLSIDTGAASVSGDLSQVKLKSLNIDTGASSIDLKLGAIESRQEVVLDAGASKLAFKIPKSVGVRVESSGGLKSTSFEGIEKVSDSVYESKGFADSEKQITIRADLGVSRFEISRY